MIFVRINREDDTQKSALARIIGGDKIWSSWFDLLTTNEHKSYDNAGVYELAIFNIKTGQHLVIYFGATGKGSFTILVKFSFFCKFTPFKPYPNRRGFHRQTNWCLPEQRLSPCRVLQAAHASQETGPVHPSSLETMRKTGRRPQRRIRC